MTTALLMLRATQLGLSLKDLELLTLGMLMDIVTESGNDHEKYPYKATQDDMDRL